jgi:hypothetical protein
MNKTDEQLAREAKQAFDQSVDGLDAATLSRLNRGRQAALAEGSRSPAFAARQWLRWVPAIGVAAAVMLILVMQQGSGDVDIIAAPASDLEILLSEESIEMLEELEFYSWIDTEDLADDGDLG